MRELWNTQNDSINKSWSGKKPSTLHWTVKHNIDYSMDVYAWRSVADFEPHILHQTLGARKQWH